MRTDRPLTRRGFLQLSGAGTAGLIAAACTRNQGTAVIPSPEVPAALDSQATLRAEAATVTAFSNLVATQVADTVATVFALLPTNSPTLIPTLEATKTPTPSMVPAFTPTPTMTYGEACEQGVTVEQSRSLELGFREISSWPAGIGLPETDDNDPSSSINIFRMRDWYKRIGCEKNLHDFGNKNRGFGVVYTHDWMEVMIEKYGGTDPSASWFNNSLEVSINSSGRIIDNDIHVWVSSYDGQFPMAKQVDRILDTELIALAETVGSQENPQLLRRQLEAQWFLARRETVSCQTIWMGGVDSGEEVKRENQNSYPLCTLYVRGIERGKEIWDPFKSVLYCSHEADIVMVWLHSMEPIAEFEGLLPRLVLTGPDERKHYVYARAFDPYSQVRVSGFSPPDNFGNHGCGTELITFCEKGGGEPEKTQKPPTSTPTPTKQPGVTELHTPTSGPTGTQPFPGETPQPTPESTSGKGNDPHEGSDESRFDRGTDDDKDDLGDTNEGEH